jgi:hypothetical protein
MILVYSYLPTYNIVYGKNETQVEESAKSDAKWTQFNQVQKKYCG